MRITPEEAKAKAEKIVNEIFRTGAGEVSARLIIELPGGRDGGGWCRAAVQSIIERILQEPK